MPAPSDPYYSHWADQAAARTVAAHPDAETYVVAAGITPSGQIHVGSSREIITVDLVARALRDRGVQVRFIYSWDDFDVFRKVPKTMPEQEMLRENLRRSIADVPDPFGEHESYAAHNIAELEDSIAPLGIDCEFIRQHLRYRAGNYAEGIRTALEHQATIRAILDEFRREPLPETWLPVAGFCDECGRDEIEFEWHGGYELSYRCQSDGCGHEERVDLLQGGNVKLPWRVDWPMRWAEERVCFEPGGKDHSSDGGSYDTGKSIVDQVYDFQAPEYVAYDFVIGRGGGKMASSKGATTVGMVLEVYEPQMLRWIFASYRPNKEFAIDFGLDVLKLYEDYDKARRIAHEAEDGGKKDKKRRTARRVMELAHVDGHRIQPGDTMSFQPSFRRLTEILQIYDGDVGKARTHYEQGGDLKTEREHELFELRARCAWNWIEKHAPDEFRYRIRGEATTRPLSEAESQVLGKLVAALRETGDASEADLVPHMKTLLEGSELTAQSFFPVVYDLLIGRPKGPKLTTLLTTMGHERALGLLTPSLGE
jgi:lysyl-tRNA synthetase class 1